MDCQVRNLPPSADRQDDNIGQLIKEGSVKLEEDEEAREEKIKESRDETRGREMKKEEEVILVEPSLYVIQCIWNDVYILKRENM